MSAAASSIPYYGRAYSLTVTTQSGETITVSSSAWEPEALQIRFRCEQAALRAYWFADIEIFNLDTGSQTPSGNFNTPISKGDTVVLCAGYQADFSPNTSVVFRGKVLQPMWERENVTDYKLTLRCVVGLLEDQNNFLNMTIPSGASQAAAILAAANGANIPVAYLDPSLDQKKLFRPVVISGRPTRFFAQVAADNHMQMWMSPDGLIIRSLAPQGTTPDATFAPPGGSNASATGTVKETVIGSPQQTEQGVLFSVLMDPSVQLGQLVQLQGATIRRIPWMIGQFPTILDKAGLYVVAGIRHVGDTRGNDWNTEITGITRNWFQIQAGLFSHA